jgi:drug/metabolite transporter (DMT)-like permease
MAAQQGEIALDATPRVAAVEARPDRLTLALFALVVLLGGASSVAISFSNRELPPFWGATLRFSGATLIFWAIVLIMRLRIPGGRALVGVLIYSLLAAASYAFLYWGLVEVPPGLTQVIIALVPLMTFFFALAHGQERFRWRGLLGAVIAVAGIALAFGERMGLVESLGNASSVPLLPMLAVVGAAACPGEAGVIVKGFPRVLPLITNAFATTVGVAVVLFLSLITRESWLLPQKAATWAALAYLVIVGSVVLFTLFLVVLSRWTASATSYQFVLLPFITVALSAWLTGEPVTLFLALGAALVLLGVWIGALRNKT